MTPIRYVSEFLFEKTIHQHPLQSQHAIMNINVIIKTGLPIKNMVW